MAPSSSAAIRRARRFVGHVVPEEANLAAVACRPGTGAGVTVSPAASEDAAVTYEVQQGHVALITLNREKNRNAMTPDLLAGVRDAVARAASDPGVRCIVITGRGRNFCGGADFRNGPLAESKTPSSSSEPATGAEATLAMYNNFLALVDVPVPVVGALQGHAIGGGLGLALCCDLRICHKSSLYGANFVRLGLHPGMATTYFLPRLLGVPKATELLLTGRHINGEEADRIGLANGVGETPEEVLSKALALAREIAANAPIAVRWTKRSIYRHQDWNPRAAAWDEANLQSNTFQTADFKEGARALLEKRSPRFEGR